MIRHGPYIIGLAKGILMLGALLMFLRSGASGEWVLLLENRLYGWSMAVYPVYWFTLLFAGLLLIFPLSLFQDHLFRMAEEHHEETPVFFWIKGLMFELLLGAVVLSLFSGAIRFAPNGWWLVVAAVWIGFYTLQPILQKAMIRMGVDEDETLPDIAAFLKTPLAEAGIELNDVVPIEFDEDSSPMDHDIVLISTGSRTRVLVPQPWVHDWTNDEITAVTLHKIWMDRLVIHVGEAVTHTICALAYIGGFALFLPHMTRMLALSEPLHPLTTATMLTAWLIAAMFFLRLCIQPVHRAWMCRADDFVVKQMRSADGLLSVLERAAKHAPADAEIPRWAEVLFFSSPSLRRRIARHT